MRSDEPLSIPFRYRDRSFDTFDASVSDTAKLALDAAMRLAGGGLRGLVLIGEPGVGKSHLAAAASRAAAVREVARYRREREAANAAEIIYVKQPAMPEWCNVPELILGLRSEMGRDEHEYRDRAERLASHRALVILDDLGREKISDWTGETVYVLVNGRYERMLPTLITSNLKPAELVANGYWPAVSRLAEEGALIEVLAPDHRLRGAA